jgi:glutamyl-tRNA reductase
LLFKKIFFFGRKACIVGSERFDFLSHLVENVSDLPAMTEAEMEKARAVAAVPPKKRKPAVEGESQTKKPKAKKNNKKVAGGAAEIVEQLQEESFVEIPNSMDEEVKDVRMHELPSFSNRFASDDEDQWNDEE